ncbi:MAG: sugar phosphate isomerase/epimerase [Burkholderiales bacterium]|jgi:hypothetical protein
MQKLLVYQSLWAMERRRPDGLEWSLAEKLEMIRDAGFDGCGVRFFDLDYAKKVTDFLGSSGMTWQAQCYPKTVADLEPILDHVKQLGADHINLQPDVKPYDIEDCVPYIEGWVSLAREAGIELHIETHRDRMTTDLFFMLHLLDCFPDLRLTGDLSHYVVGREFLWPVSEENHAYMHRVLDNCWGFHGRVASREQVQVQISFAHHKDWVDLFMNWWEYGFRSWRKRAPQDATLTFLCELGPKEYAMTGPDGYELSDRWQEAQILKDMIRDLWAKIEAEDVSLSGPV